MNTKISCKNVVKVKFDSVKLDDATVQPLSSPAIQQNIHSEEINGGKNVNSSKSPGNSQENSPLLRPLKTGSKPPRAKQLQSICLLIDQHNQNCSVDDCGALFLIDTEWMNAWYRCVVSNDMNLYPGPISNWSLVDNGHTASKTASVTRASQMRGLSFDGEECDFAEELEQFQIRCQNPANATELSVQIDYDYNSCKFKVRRGLRESVDFYLLPIEAWQALHGWYGGGPPLSRYVTHSLRARASVPCVVAADLLQLALPEDYDTTNSTPVLHELDLYPDDENQLPCIVDAISNQAGLPAALMRRTEEDFGSTASMSKSLSTTSFPSMVDLNTVRHASAVHQGIALPLPTVSRQASAGTVACDNTAAAAAAAAGTIVQKKLATFCHVCKRGAVNRCSKCGSIFYCSRECQALHWKFHKIVCAKLAKTRKTAEEEKDLCGSTALAATTAAVKHDRAGKVGLANLGNSCYMNSSLQCLSHIKPLTVLFLSQRIMRDLNVESRDGSGGKLAEQYGKLLQELWFEPNKKSLSPHLLKATLGRINSEYAGLAQQDAHELIELLLDKLHEDLNRVRKKPYTEKVEWDGKKEEKTVAEESWATHGLREDSVVRDLMGSLMRYQLTCVGCGRVSLSFEYHTTIQVAIPRQNTVSKRVIFVPQVLSVPKSDSGVFGSAASSCAEESTILNAILKASEPVSFDVTLDRLSAVRALREAVRKRIPQVQLQSSGDEVLLVESAPAPSTSEVARILRDGLALGKLQEDAVIYAYCPPMARPNHVFVLQRTFQPSVEADAAAEPQDIGDLVRPSLVGVPLLVSYEKQWSCCRLRYQIFLNSLRLFKRDCDFLRKASAVLSGPIPVHVDFSNSLDIRLVDPRGVSLVSRVSSSPGIGGLTEGSDDYVQHLSKVWDSNISSVGDAQRKQEWLDMCVKLANTTMQGGGVSVGVDRKVESLFGSSLAIDRQLLIGDFGNISAGVRSSEPNPVLFFSLDMISQTPSSAMDSDKLNQFLQQGDGVKTPGSVGGPLSLYQCLQEHTREELLEAGNEVYCPRCKEHRSARKVVRFCRAHLPPVLVLSLKRFEYRDVSGVMGFHGAAHREKIDAFVDFPLDGLNLRAYCQPDQDTNSTEVNIITSGANTADNADRADRAAADNDISDSIDLGDAVYDLFAVCNHYGRMGFGHYTAAARDWKEEGLSADWYSYDDDDVSGPCTAEEIEAEVHSRNAYILFYRRRGSPSIID